MSARQLPSSHPYRADLTNCATKCAFMPLKQCRKKDALIFDDSRICLAETGKKPEDLLTIPRAFHYSVMMSPPNAASPPTSARARLILRRFFLPKIENCS